MVQGVTPPVQSNVGNVYFNLGSKLDPPPYTYKVEGQGLSSTEAAALKAKVPDNQRKSFAEFGAVENDEQPKGSIYVDLPEPLIIPDQFPVLGGADVGGVEIQINEATGQLQSAYHMVSRTDKKNNIIIENVPLEPEKATALLKAFQHNTANLPGTLESSEDATEVIVSPQN